MVTQMKLKRMLFMDKVEVGHITDKKTSTSSRKITMKNMTTTKRKVNSTTKEDQKVEVLVEVTAGAKKEAETNM